MACDERELVLRARAGDRDAQAALTASHGERVLRFLQVMTGDPSAADDLAQDTWSTALAKLDQLAAPERFANWLLAIAYASVSPPMICPSTIIGLIRTPQSSTATTRSTSQTPVCGSTSTVAM